MVRRMRLQRTGGPRFGEAGGSSTGSGWRNGPTMARMRTGTGMMEMVGMRMMMLAMVVMKMMMLLQHLTDLTAPGCPQTMTRRSITVTLG